MQLQLLQTLASIISSKMYQAKLETRFWILRFTSIESTHHAAGKGSMAEAYKANATRLAQTSNTE